MRIFQKFTLDRVNFKINHINIYDIIAKELIYPNSDKVRILLGNLKELQITFS